MNILSHELGISRHTLRRFVEDFNLNISDVVDDGLNVKEDFLKFVHENKEFLKAYDEDIHKVKTSKEIAEKIKKPVEDVEGVLKHEFPNIYQVNGFRTMASTFSIDKQLGGDYQFVYNYFDKQSLVEHYEFVGYRDLFFYILDAIEPFINPGQLENWGISRPAGILLYGPPGSGKIFWARKIAELIGYEFMEIKDQYFSLILGNGKAKKLNDFLCGKGKKPKSVVFMQNFDEFSMGKIDDEPLKPALLNAKNAVLQSIQYNLKEEILYIGSVSSAIGLDEEILAPGRFDVLIPVFPPNVEERAEMILIHMLKGLGEKSPLLSVLKQNNADQLSFWGPVAERMKLFSNTMMIDFTQSLKKKIHSEFLRVDGKNVLISDNLVLDALGEATSKLTTEYLNEVSDFIVEFNANSGSEFPQRIQELMAELDQYKVKEAPQRKIGFNTEEDQKTNDGEDKNSDDLN